MVLKRRFQPEQAAAEVRARLWRYLSASASPIDLTPIAEELFSLPRGELRRLTAVHLALQPATAEMLDAAARLLRELPSSVERSEVELVGAVRPPVAWERTARRRWATGNPALFVCRPAERRYDTPLARLVRLALERCLDLANIAELVDRGSTGARLAQLAQDAAHLLEHSKLRDVRLVPSIPERTLRNLARQRHAQQLIEFVRGWGEALDDQDPIIVRRVIDSMLLSPAQPDRLFELMSGFEVVDALRGAGFTELETRLIATSEVPFARLQRNGTNMTLWWQRSLWSQLPNSLSGRYTQVLDSAGLSRSKLRPDFLITTDDPARLLLIEVKLTERDDYSPDRRGIVDALAYLHDAQEVLEPFPEPHVLVIAWNSNGVPSEGPVVVTSQDDVAIAVTSILESWSL